MGLPAIGSFWKRKRGSGTPPSADTILSADGFRQAMARERAAADRHQQQFSVVVFDLGDTPVPADRLEGLIVLLRKRTRITDQVGWFAKETVAVLLPFTGAEGAGSVLHDVRRLLAERGISVDGQVFTYPSDEHPTRDRRADRSEERRGASRGVGPRRPAGGRVTDAEPVTAADRAERRGGDPHPSQPTAVTGAVWPMEPLFARPLPRWKRVFDIVGAIASLILLSPVMAVTALAIKLTSEGPVIFRQHRSGWRARPFTFYKFRSMYTGAEAKKHELLAHNHRTGPVFKMENDPRITPVGRFIRKWSIDELPQLFNVLKGDMSLVGPRPPTLDEVDHYQTWQDRRLEVTPGMTCLWQVYARDDKCFEHWVRLDIEYARKQSFFFDLKILALTIPAVLSRRGAC